MPGKEIRLIIDTNLWISFLLNKDFSKLDKLLLQYKIKLIFSLELLEEFLEVAQRPKFEKYFTVSDIESVLTLIGEVAEFVTVKSNINVCRDKKDNYLLALAVDAQADFLLTGDQDLLDLKTIEGIGIIQISDFLNNHQ